MEKVAKELEESGMDDRESFRSRRQWMKKFSKVKVGPPKGAKTVMDQADPSGRAASMIEKMDSPKRLIRTAEVEVKKRLE